jgi:hypothetical protein
MASTRSSIGVVPDPISNESETGLSSSSDSPRSAFRRAAGGADQFVGIEPRRQSQQRQVPAATVRTLWALTVPELYLRQVRELGLTADADERWLASLLQHALLPD